MASIRSCREFRRASGSRLATARPGAGSSGRLAMARVSASWAALTAGQLPGFWPGPGPAGRSAAGQLLSSPVEARAESEVIGDRQPGVDRRVWARNPILASCAGPGRGRPPSTSIVPAVGAKQPGGRFSSVVFPARSGRPGPRPARPGHSACSQPAPTAPVPLAQPAGSRRRSRYVPRSRYDLLSGGPKGAEEQGLDALVVQPARRALGQPPLQVAAQRPCAASDAPASVPVTNVPIPGRPPPGPRYSSPVGLDHVFGLIASPATTSLDVGSWSPWRQQAQPQCWRTWWMSCRYGATPERPFRWNSNDHDLQNGDYSRSLFCR